MIDYVEEFLGLDPGYIVNDDAAIVFMIVIMAILLFGSLKTILLWFEKIFGRS